MLWVTAALVAAATPRHKLKLGASGAQGLPRLVRSGQLVWTSSLWRHTDRSNEI